MLHRVAFVFCFLAFLVMVIRSCDEGFVQFAVVFIHCISFIYIRIQII